MLGLEAFRDWAHPVAAAPAQAAQQPHIVGELGSQDPLRAMLRNGPVIKYM